MDSGGDPAGKRFNWLAGLQLSNNDKLWLSEGIAHLDTHARAPAHGHTHTQADTHTHTH